jgi:predicted 2-oxoglutarate/Fe(II)-dependent dioxygenase YbiX
MRISTLYGVAAQEPGTDKIRYRPTSFVIDPNLRVLHVLPITDPGTHADKLADLVAGLFRVDDAQVMAQFAPVVVVPRVLEPEFCRQLIDLYDRHGGQDSGFMRADIATGKTIGTIDYGTKRRRDYVISDQEVRAALRNRLNRRLVPEIQKVFQYKATRIERYMVACYDAGEGGYFRAHRDNTTKGTAHRRFAVTINLNAEEYEGGDLRFPEYGPRTYRAPTGGAVVFSCSMLHEATPIVAGRRYCTLPFLYDDEGAKVRRENASSIVEVQRGETPGGGPAADGPAEPTTAPA